jgi:hypothetical protein
MIPNPRDPSSTNLVRQPETSEDYVYNLCAKYGINDEVAATKMADAMDKLWTSFEVPVKLTAEMLDEILELIM